MNYKIYGLHTVGSDVIRYVGYTKRTLKQRLKSHFFDVTQGNTYKKCEWIKKYNFNIDIVLLESGLSYEDALIREKYWIKYHNTFNSGMNMSEGGDVNPMENPEVRAKHAIKMKQIAHKLGRNGEDNWMTSEQGKAWFQDNNPMHNIKHKETHRKASLKRRVVVDADELRRLYIDENKTLVECSEHFDVSYHSIVRNLKRNGIRKYK